MNMICRLKTPGLLSKCDQFKIMLKLLESYQGPGAEGMITKVVRGMAGTRWIFWQVCKVKEMQATKNVNANHQCQAKSLFGNKS